MNGIIGGVEPIMWLLQCFSGGERVHLLAQKGSAVSKVFRFSRFCAGITELDMDALCACPDKATEVLQATCDRLGIDVLIPTGMPCTCLLAQIKDRLRGIHVYPCPSDVDELQQLSSKLGFARILDRLELAQPNYWVLSSAEDAIGEPLTYPIVLKPLNLDNALGIRVCHNPGEVLEHFRFLQSLTDPPYIAQEYIPGLDMDLTILADHGQVVAWAIYTYLPGKSGGKIYRFVEHEGYLDAGKRLARALNHHGLLHIDGRLSELDGSVKMIECNPRVFGSIHYTSFAGVNFVKAGLDIARGIKPASPCKQINGELNLGFLRFLRKSIQGYCSSSPIGDAPSHAKVALPALKTSRPFFLSRLSIRALVSLLRDPLPLLALAFHQRKARRKSAVLDAKTRETVAEAR